MANIYQQHDAAFPLVSAYVIVKGGERVATVAFKFPKDGAGRMWCYLHVSGIPMVRGYASGYGYDKKSAAFESAARKVEIDTESAADCTKYAWQIIRSQDGDSGQDWDRRLRDAGFEVWQAV